MELKGFRYSLEFEENLKESISWGGGGHYEEKYEISTYYYEGTAIIKDLEKKERYLFDFRTNEASKNNLKEKIINTGEIKLSEKEESKLIDLLAGDFLKKVGEHKNGFRANIYFEGKEFNRIYLEDKGIIDEIDGQKRIIFD